MLGLDYAEQLKQKEAAVRKLVGKYGPVAPIRGAENPCHYRNKVISTFAAGPGGKLVSGIYAAGTHKVLPVESCLLQDEVLDTVMQAVRAAASTCRYQPYNEDKGTGLLRWITEAAAAGQRADVIFMDPPREGSTPQFIESVARMAPKRVVYVSCNPETMARDLALLTAKGYRAEGFTPVDLFPQTAHCEVVGALTRSQKSKG